MQDLTAFQRDLLYVLAGIEDGKHDEPHGLAIKEALEDYYYREIHHGRLYPNLDTLTDEGLVEKGKQDQRTNSYHLTDQGIECIRTRHDWENGQMHGKP